MTKEAIMKAAWRLIIMFAFFSYCFFLYSYKDQINGVVFNDKVKLSDLIGVLLNISSIIFAVCGAWVALVFPKALEKLTDNDGKLKFIATNDEVVAFKDISISSSLSLIVIVILLCVNYIISLGSLLSSYQNIKVVCFYVVSFLYFFQVYVLLITAKVTMKVFSSYGMSLINRSARNNYESQTREDE